MIDIKKTISVCLFISSFLFAGESKIVIKGTADPVTSAQMIIGAKGENKAYILVDKLCVEEGARLVVWDLDAIPTAEICGAGKVVYLRSEINALLQLFDEWVESGILYGIGRGQAASNKLTAVRNMLIEAGNDVSGVCDQLFDAYQKTDGLPNPPDFVAGQAASMLAGKIQDLRDDIQCDLDKSINLTAFKSENIEKETDLQEITTPIPDKFGLIQNYPNPFNPETQIRFQLPHDAHVILEIYNMLGQRIRILSNRNFEGGYYNITWDGKDNKGNKMTSGVYIYKIQAGEFQDVKKMVLLR